MKHFIVAADGFDRPLFKELCQQPSFDVYPKPKLSYEELLPLLPKIHGIIVRSATQIKGPLLEKATQLKYVIRAGEGTDNIDLIECRKRNIKVANTPGANSNSAAEMAIALMFAVLRKTSWAHQSMVQGEWEKTLFSGLELANKTIGIIGFGRIGKLVAKRLSGFEPKIIYYDSHVMKESAHEKVEKVERIERVENLKDIFVRSDIISLHIPYSPSTHNLIGKEFLNLMPAESILINASRGNIVVEEDLIEALSSQKIRGAGFDVFAQEPLPKNSLLRQLPNLVLTPHLGASTDEAQKRVGEMVVHQIKEFFINNNLINEVQ